MPRDDNSPLGKEVHKMVDTLRSITQVSVMSAIDPTSPGAGPDSVYMLACASLAGMGLLSSFVGKCPHWTPEKPCGCDMSKSTPEDHITDESILFAALLCSHVYNVAPDGVYLRFGKLEVWETLVSFQKLTGRKADPYIVPQIVQAGYEAAKTGDDLFDKLRQSGQGSGRLN